jgi:hypothetical protein
MNKSQGGRPPASVKKKQTWLVFIIKHEKNNADVKLVMFKTKIAILEENNILLSLSLSQKKQKDMIQT